MPSPDNRPHFSVHPSVVLQLGEGLISDAVQALIELVKNSYDADASYAKVIIDTVGTLGGHGLAGAPSNGRIIVEDDGFGMDEDAIVNGWLVVSNRSKRNLKEAKQTTRKGRTPLGDKGLGRLGVQKLGDRVDVFTKEKSKTPYHFGFSWLDFATAPSLSDVDIQFEPTDFDREAGTRIVVSELREPEFWRGDEALKRLQQELSRMISPFRAIRDFIVVITADGKTIDLEDISDRVRELAPVRYTIGFDGQKLSIVGRASLDFFRPPNKKDLEEFALVAEADSGARFFEHLASTKRASYFNLVRASDPRWFIDFRIEKSLDAMDQPESDPIELSRPANPGPFWGEIDSFDLSRATFSEQNIFDRIKDFRTQIQRMSGIRVYRDGFAVRVDDDWLGLGKGWTSAGSYYGLKPGNTVGFIALSARENMQLEETTDREGFKDTPYYRNFYLMLTEFKKFTSEAHEFFGRSWSDFLKARREQIARVDTRQGVEGICRDITASVQGASTQKAAVSRLSSRLSSSLDKSSTVIGRLVTAENITPPLQAEAKETLLALTVVAADTQNILKQLTSYLRQLEQMNDLGQVLVDRVDNLRRQVDDMYETVALGLTAEAIAHEVFQITDNLASRTKALQSRSCVSTAIESYLDHVQGSILALRKQVSYLSPGLRYVRDRREEIAISDALHEIAQFYEPRLERNRIRMTITDSNDKQPLTVRMNRGKLSQICDNFILNSEYWLKQDIAAQRIDEGIITFEIDRPFVRIFDNGRGIDPSIEGALFEPFMTAKLRNEGRGLGLFIVKQLLDSEGCHVGVVPERNKSNRLYIFQLDFRGALHDK